ncbi:MAG: MgtC/SapB family protein [Ideonella sp.]
MSDTTALLPTAHWPYLEVLVRLALSLALGLLIGLERERRGKEAGLRTFGFICLLGALGGTMGTAYAVVILVLVGMLAVLLNVQTLRANQGTELTTSAAMLVTCMSGILCGLGHTISPAAVMVIATALLAWKERLAGFSMGLTEGEMRSALLLAILAIVIYPALPQGPIGPWDLIDPRAAWVTVILIAGIGFVNYILWKLYGTRGAELSSFLGGLVNSTFTAIELLSRISRNSGAFIDSAYRGMLLATTAMLVRNAGLLMILAPLALLGSLAAFILMLVTSIFLVLWSYRSRADQSADDATQLKLDVPFSLTLALKYGVVFLVLHIVGGLTQRQFGDVGFYFVSVVGGLMSSASAVAAAATLAEQGSISPAVAGTGAVLASLTSIAFSLSFVLKTHHRGLIGRLATAMVCIAAAGLIGILIWGTVRPMVEHWIPQMEKHAH